MKRIRQRPSTHHALAVGVALITILALAFGWRSGWATASPARPATAPGAHAQNVDYLTASDAQALDIGINVLVPSWLPAPFGGEPQIGASNGYYSLYWVIPGAPPTFLEVTGTAGGALPAGSPADLNNQLFINASVRGLDAIHDLTNVYDNVWWIEGGVLYEVSSLNMTGTDSMGLANSLVTLTMPAADTGEAAAPSDQGDASDSGGDSGANDDVTTPPADDQGATDDTDDADTAVQASISVAGPVPSGNQATVVVGGVANATLTASDGVFTDTGAASYANIGSQSVQWQSPDTAADEAVTFTLTDPDSGATLTSAQITVTGTGQASAGDASATQAPAETANSSQAQQQSASPANAPALQPAAPADQTGQATRPRTTSTSASTPARSDSGANSARRSDGTGGTASAVAAQQTQGPAPAATQPPRELGSAQLSDGTGGPPPPVYAGDGTGGSYVVTYPVNDRRDR